MDINPIDQGLIEQLGIQKQEAAPSDKLGQGDFMKLMTAQLNNQDPMKPMEGGEFFNQIAQFSTVSGIQELQSSFDKVANAMFSSQALQASGMVGRTVMVPSDRGALGDAGSVTAAFDVPAATNDLQVNIYDVSGQLVRTANLGASNAGSTTYNWDGRGNDGSQLPQGQYILKAQAKYDDETLALESYIAEKVESVSIGNNGAGVTLNLAGQGPVSLGSIKQIM